MQVLISGGEGGLARAMAAEFSCRGACVAAPSRAEMDVSSRVSVDGFVEGLGEGGVDLAVCAAGVTEDGLLLRMDERAWQKVVEVNLHGAMRVARAVLPKMLRKRGGHIVLVGSFSAYHPPVGQAAYAAAKGGLEGLAKSLAKEVGRKGVRVNVVVPGFLDTKMTAGLAEGVREAALEMGVLGGINSVDHVAKFVAFLHEEMTMTSGQIFHLDSRI